MRKLIFFWILCFSFLLPVYAYADTEAETEIQEAEIIMDSSDLKDIENSITAAKDKLAIITRKEDKQFDKMLIDVLGGTYNGDAYLAPLHMDVFNFIKFVNTKLSATVEKKIQIAQKRAVRRKDKAWAKRAQNTLDDLSQFDPEIEKYSHYLSKDRKKITLTNDIFQSRAEEVFSKILNKTLLLKFLDINDDRVEYFLTGYAEKIYPGIMAGKKPHPWSTSKLIIRDALIKINIMDTFSTEKNLRAAVAKYPENDELALLYSYILLINKSDPKKVELGYKHLSRSFDRLETEKLAFNLVRVGLRIGKLQEGRILKIIDHVGHRNDVKTLAKLNNMLLYYYIQNDEFDKAVDYLEELKSNQFDLSEISPVMKFLIFLKQGNFEMISTDVAPYDTERQVEELITS
ncbi:MAG: hypothetical protein GY941_24830 [Planctomycetes bacterium]|nr:hypothetical protein [Planctomycetota bacterium]